MRSIKFLHDRDGMSEYTSDFLYNAWVEPFWDFYVHYHIVLLVKH